MRFFIDTANLKEIKEANDLGILDGVTTNPSLMAKEGITGAQNINQLEICYRFIKNFIEERVELFKLKENNV